MELRVQNCRLLPEGSFRRQDFHFTARFFETLRKLFRHIRRDRLCLARPVIRSRSHLDFHHTPDIARRIRSKTRRVIEQQSLLIRIFVIHTQRPRVSLVNLCFDGRF